MFFVKKTFFVMVLAVEPRRLLILHSQPFDSGDCIEEYLSMPDMANELAKAFPPPAFEVILALAPSRQALADAFPEITNWPLFLEELCGHA